MMNESVTTSHSEVWMSRLRGEEAEKEVYRLKKEIKAERSMRSVHEATCARKHASKVRRLSEISVSEKVLLGL